MKLSGLFCLIFSLSIFFVSCAPGPNSAINTDNEKGYVAGFGEGTWHGMTSNINFIISLFNKDVQFYEVHNSGRPYSAGLFFGGIIYFALFILSIALWKKAGPTIILVAMIISLIIFGGSPGANPLCNTANQYGVIAGFWLGLWHGIIFPFTFIGSFFSNNIQFYEAHNSGILYNIGFILGMMIMSFPGTLKMLVRILGTQGNNRASPHQTF